MNDIAQPITNDPRKIPIKVPRDSKKAPESNTDADVPVVTIAILYLLMEL